MQSNLPVQKALLRLALVTLPSLCACALLVEIGLRLLVPVSDPLPRGVYDHDAEVLISQPGDQGTYVKQPEINADYSINNAGWNSPHDYTLEKQPGVVRVAVIGDSYVESMEVDIDKSFLILLEEALSQAINRPVEVYNFGKSGAPLSEYLQIMRYAVSTYQPDITIITIVDNDFEESFVEYGLPYFLSFELEDDGTIVEIPPIPYEPSKQVTVFRVLARSALVRYLAYNLDYLTRIKLMRMNQPVELQAEDTGERRAQLSALVQYAFAQYASVAASHGSRLLVVLDAPREDIYRGRSLEESDIFIYHDITRSVADEQDIAFLDLTDAFSRDYEMNRQSFNFENDYHWNEYGHRLVAASLLDQILALGWVGPQDSTVHN